MSPVHISTLDGSIWMSRNTVWISDFCNSASSYGEIIGKTTHKQQMEQHHSPILFIIYSYGERDTSDKAWVGRNERKTTLFSRLEAAIFDQETMMRVQLWRRLPGREFPVHVTVKCTWLKNDLISGVSGTPSRSTSSNLFLENGRRFRRLRSNSWWFEAQGVGFWRWGELLLVSGATDFPQLAQSLIPSSHSLPCHF